MTRTALVLAALTMGLGLASAGFVRAEDPAPAQPAASAPTNASANGSASSDQKASQPAAATSSSDSQTYSAKPLPGDTTGVYLPSAVGGYVRSTASCVVLGCDNGPEVKVEPSSSSGAKPPPSGPPTDSGPAGALH